MADFNPRLSDLDEALSNQLKAIAEQQNCLLMSFISPKPVKTSPIDIDYATIAVDDIYTLEENIEKLQEKKELPKKLHLVIHTPGGSSYATTKIAKYLRSLFDAIDVYIPYEAASGGTMLCLAANIIVMDKLSNLTPIDPQTPYKGEYVSAVSFEQAVEELHRQFSNKRPGQIPSPYQQLCDELDPIILKEKNKLVIEAVLVAWDLLKKSQNPMKQEIKGDEKKQAEWEKKNDALLDTARYLTRTFWPHSHVIDFDDAKQLGLNVVNEKSKLDQLKIYKKWVSKRLEEPRLSHIIECFAPIEVRQPSGLTTAATSTDGSSDEKRA